MNYGIRSVIVLQIIAKVTKSAKVFGKCFSCFFGTLDVQTKKGTEDVSILIDIEKRAVLISNK